jgi:predicted nucleic acid-binding protein
MKLVIDTNIILSALIKDSITRKIIIESNWEFYYPLISFYEINKYKNLVLKKSNISKEKYELLLMYLFKHIILIKNDKILNNLEKAKNIMFNIDPNDVVFIATALSIKNSIIWSDDNDFKKQNDVLVVNTEEIINDFF